jgi:hypothetical protein
MLDILDVPPPGTLRPVAFGDVLCGIRAERCDPRRTDVRECRRQVWRECGSVGGPHDS